MDSVETTKFLVYYGIDPELACSPYALYTLKNWQRKI